MTRVVLADTYDLASRCMWIITVAQTHALRSTLLAMSVTVENNSICTPQTAMYNDWRRTRKVLFTSESLTRQSMIADIASLPVRNALFASTAKLHCVWQGLRSRMSVSGRQRREGRSWSAARAPLSAMYITYCIVVRGGSSPDHTYQKIHKISWSLDVWFFRYTSEQRDIPTPWR